MSWTEGAVLSRAAFETLTTFSRVDSFPLASRAVAASVWSPFGHFVVSQASSYGAMESSAASGTLSTVNVIAATDSGTSATTSTEPETVSPAGGVSFGQIFFVELPRHSGSVASAPANPTHATAAVIATAVKKYKERETARGLNMSGGMGPSSAAYRAAYSPIRWKAPYKGLVRDPYERGCSRPPLRLYSEARDGAERVLANRILLAVPPVACRRVRCARVAGCVQLHVSSLSRDVSSLSRGTGRRRVPLIRARSADNVRLMPCRLDAMSAQGGNRAVFATR